MFSKARLENKRRKSVTFPHNMMGTSISGALSTHVLGAIVLPYSLASPPPAGLCLRMRGAVQVPERPSALCSSCPGLLRTEKGNNDSALSKQLPVVLKLLQT